MNSKVFHGGSAGRGSWPASVGLPPAIIAALTSPSALPILNAMSQGFLAIADVTPPAGYTPVAGYDLVFNDLDGATKIEYPNASIDKFDLSPTP